MKGAARHFNVQGSLTLKNIILDGYATRGGLDVTGTATMDNNAVIQNCQANVGGGVYVNGGSFIMSGTAKLSGNRALVGNGGGLFTTNYSNILIGSNAMFAGNLAPSSQNLGLTQLLYTTAFPTITSPFGPYYSTSANHPVNNYDINILQYSITVRYVDESGNLLSMPAPISATSKTYQLAAGLPFALDGTGDRIIPVKSGYFFADWAIGSPTAKAGNTNVSLPCVTGHTDVYLIYKETPITTVTISNTVKGDYANRTKAFPFKIYFYSDPNGAAPLASGTAFTCTGGIIAGSGATAPLIGSLTLGASGEATFDLKHGQMITLQGIPKNGCVRIVREGASDFFVASFKDSADADITRLSDTGVRLVGNQPRTFDFFNTMAQVVPTDVKAPDTIKPVLFATLILLAAILITARLRNPRKYRFALQHVTSPSRHHHE